MNDFAKTYGSALYELAQDEQIEGLILEQLGTVATLLQENPEYAHLMDSRALPKAERLALLDEAFSGKINPYLINFMKILLERGAFNQLALCRQAYENGYNEKHNIVLATAVSAVTLTEDQQKRLIEALEKKTGKTVRLNVEIDPSLRGGMRVHTGGYRFDNSISARMEQLRRALNAQA